MELHVTRPNVIDYLPPRFGAIYQFRQVSFEGILQAAVRIVPFLAVAALAAALFVR